MKYRSSHVQLGQSLFLSLGILAFGLGVPILEINDSHVFNSDWTPHALIHEVWQLITNSTLALVCLWLVWIRRETQAAAALGLIVTGSFLIAFSLQDLYGGSMKYLDGSEKTVLGINIGVVGFGVAIMMFMVCLLSDFLRNDQQCSS